MPAGGGGRQGMGWGFDCLCWPWDRAFDWPCSPREAVYSILSSPDVEIFLTGFDCQLGRKRLRPNICFPKCYPSLNYLTLVMQQRNIKKISDGYLEIFFLCLSWVQLWDIWQRNVQPGVMEFGCIWLEWFARGRGIWLHTFGKCQIPTPCPTSPPPPPLPALHW